MILLLTCIAIYQMMDAERDRLRFRPEKAIIKVKTKLWKWNIGAWWHRRWWKLGWWNKNVFIMFNDGEHFLKFFSYHILLLPINYELATRHFLECAGLGMLLLFIAEAIVSGILFNTAYYGKWRWDKYE